MPIRTIRFYVPALALCLSILTSYFIFDSLSRSAGKHFISSWLQSETVDLQQGGILTSISKFDRMMSYRKDIKAILLVKYEPGAPQRTLMNIGPSGSVPSISSVALIEGMAVKNIGIFEYLIISKILPESDIFLVAHIFSFDYFVMLSLNIFFASIILAFTYVWQGRFLRAQETQRSKFLSDTISEIMQHPNAKLQHEVVPEKINSSEEMKLVLLCLHRKMIENDRLEVISSLAQQVSHDIRSPLSALNIVLSSLSEASEDQRSLIGNATRRINDIANQLLDRSKLSTAETKEYETTEYTKPNFPSMLVKSIGNIVGEKRLQFRERSDIKIHADLTAGYGLFSTINDLELERAISNLINNSIEAIESNGTVTVQLISSDSMAFISIIDNGKGIAQEVIARLGEKGVSMGKDGSQSGSGLGLYHAQKVAKEAGGYLLIESHPGAGTRVTIAVPTATPPSWFIDKLELGQGAAVISADNDNSTHEMLEHRFSDSEALAWPVRHLAFSSFSEFESWLKMSSGKDSVLLLDYEFIQNSDIGFDIIERHGISSQTILLSPTLDDPKINLIANKLGVRLLSKRFISVIPIVYSNM